MKTTRSKIEFVRVPKDYARLCGLHTPLPIRYKVDFNNATEITDAMAGHKLTPDQEDYFDLLCRLIEDYEKEHVQLDTPKVTALEALPHTGVSCRGCLRLIVSGGSILGDVWDEEHLTRVQALKRPQCLAAN